MIDMKSLTAGIGSILALTAIIATGTWPLVLISGVIVCVTFGFWPMAATLLMVKLYPKGHARRKELVSDATDMLRLDRWTAPIWVAQTFALVLFEGLPLLIKAGRGRSVRGSGGPQGFEEFEFQSFRMLGLDYSLSEQFSLVGDQPSARAVIHPRTSRLEPVCIIFQNNSGREAWLWARSRAVGSLPFSDGAFVAVVKESYSGYQLKFSGNWNGDAPIRVEFRSLRDDAATGRTWSSKGSISSPLAGSVTLCINANCELCSSRTSYDGPSRTKVILLTAFTALYTAGVFALIIFHSA